MNDTKHTPGPWTFSGIHRHEVRDGTITVHHDQPIQHYGIRYIYRDEKDRRCTVQIGQAFITAGREQEAVANARLIAAAPEMLAALQLITPAYTQHNGETPIVQTARAAIAKAEGAS